MTTPDLLSLSSHQRKELFQKTSIEDLVESAEKVLSSSSFSVHLQKEVQTGVALRYISSQDASGARLLLDVLFKHLHRQDPSVQESTMFLLLNQPQGSRDKIVDVLTHPLVLEHAYPRWIHLSVYVSFLRSGKPTHQDALLWKAISSTLRPDEWVGMLNQEHEKQRFFKENRRDQVQPNLSPWMDLFESKPFSWQQECVNLWTDRFPQKSLVQDWEACLEKWLLTQHLSPSPNRSCSRKI